MPFRNSEELSKLYEVARNAKAARDFEKAREYYEKVAEIDKDKWEPVFYSYYQVYFDNWVTHISKDTQKTVEEQIGGLWSVLLNAVKMIAADNSIDKKAAIIEVYNVLMNNYNGFYQHLKGQSEGIKENIRNDQVNDSSSRKIELNLVGCIAYRYAKMIYEFGDTIIDNALNCNTPSGINIPTSCWKIGNGLIYFAFTTMAYPIVKDSQNYILVYTAKIRQSESDYQPPVLPKVKSSGCYIATCVYGSYDCPQVWTLRRYRDEQLSYNVFGRIFIRTYYLISPVLVRWFGSCKWFKRLWKPILDRMVNSLNSKGFKDTPYHDC